jgi:AraC family transcriptional regulator
MQLSVSATGLGRTEQRDAGILGGDVLAELIIEASSAFDTDQGKAKRCIERAVELVRGKQPLGASRLGPAPVRGGLCGWQVRQVKAYIEANIGGRIPIANLAALARQSMGHFFRTFRASFGESPQAYILRQRILRAEQLIRNSDEPLARIALDCGLCDQAHLSRVFRRIVGVSPSAWRRRVALDPQQTVTVPGSQYTGALADRGSDRGFTPVAAPLYQRAPGLSTTLRLGAR